MPLTNEQLIDACTVRIRSDAAVITTLKKAAVTAARDAEINARVAKAAGAQPTGVFVDGIRQARATAAVSRINADGVMGRLHQGTVLEKAKKKAAAAPPGAELSQHLNDAADALKANEGLTESHPAVQALRQAAYSYADPDDSDDGESDDGDLAKAAVTRIRTDPQAGRFGPIKPGRTGSTARQVSGGFNQGGS